MNTAAPPKPSAPGPRPPTPAGAIRATQAPPAKSAVLGHIDATARPSRIVINAVEGWGKTSCAAYTPGAAILMAKGETGYETLLGAGLVPSVPVARIESWAELLGTIDAIITEPGEIKTLALDAIGGFERLCHEEVCRRDFDNNWGEKGFGSYQKGYDLSVSDWLQLLQRLDRLRDVGVSILVLAHSTITPFKNPLGPDYDRYGIHLHRKTWDVTGKWADAVLFGTFLSVIEKDGERGKAAKHGKGIGGTTRVAYTERCDAYDAKNRYGMPAQLEIPDDPALIWSTIAAAMKH